MAADRQAVPVVAGRMDGGARVPFADLVRRAVREHVGKASAVLLAGSAKGGDLPADGDLDIIVFTGAGRNRSRRLLVRKRGVLIEMFIIAERDYPALLQEARRTALPSLLRMCKDSRILEGGKRAKAIVKAAKQAFAEGPVPVAYAELDRRRWELTELSDDFRHASRPEALFVAGRMLEKTAEFLLRANDRWLGVGKWAYRTLAEYDNGAARELAKAAEAFYRRDERLPFIRFVERTLAPFGGPLREGWQEEAALRALPAGAKPGRRRARRQAGKRRDGGRPRRGRAGGKPRERMRRKNGRGPV